MLFRTGEFPSGKMWCSPTSADLHSKMTVEDYEFGVQNKRSMISLFSCKHSKVPPL